MDHNHDLHKRGLEHSAEGKMDQLKGKTKEAFGELTNDKKLKAEGKIDQAKGKMKDAMGKAERKLSDRE